ncbi:MAG: GFA family protein [Nitratireductor sp.]
MRAGRFEGACHCGAVRFSVALDLDQPVYRCTCSLCRRKGALMAAAAKTELNVTQGWAQLSVYQFNTKVAKHYFCRTCGIYPFHQRRIDPQTYGVNVGCLEGVDPQALTVILEDGATE